MAFVDVLGCSRAHCAIVEKIRQVAHFDAEVLISGPTGAGKEVYARLVHSSRPYAKGPFIAVNCGALPGPLFENELFGHSANAYTGARNESEGLAEAAEGGTLFLDEVDSLALPAQVTLLRFVQFREYRRLGETRLRRFNARLIAASSADLPAAVKEGRFREDLYYRLRVIPIEVPSLKERRDDVMTFFDAFSEFYSKSYGAPEIKLSGPARSAILGYAWPGNVRELENCVRYLTCLQLGRAVEPGDLPFHAKPAENEWLDEELLTLPLKQAKRKLVRTFEKQYLERALNESSGNISKAARVSGKNRRAFFELMRQHGLDKLSEWERAREVKPAIIDEVTPPEPAAREASPEADRKPVRPESRETVFANRKAHSATAGA